MHTSEIHSVGKVLGHEATLQDILESDNLIKFKTDQINNIASEAALLKREDALSLQDKGLGEGMS